MGLSPKLHSEIDVNPEDTEQPFIPVSDPSDIDPVEDLQDLMAGTGSAGDQRSSELDSLERTKKSARFLVNVMEGRRFTQAAIGDVIDGCHELCTQNAMRGKEAVEVQLAQTGLSPSLFELPDLYEDPFEGLSTPYLQHKFIADHFSYVVSPL